MPKTTESAVKEDPTPAGSSRPDWARGGGPLIAGPPDGKRWTRSGRQPALPSAAREEDRQKWQWSEGPSGASRSSSWKASQGWRLALAAAGLAILAALAGLLGGRLGRDDDAPPGERPNAAPPPAQPAPQPSMPSATLSQVFEKVAPAVVQVIPAAGPEAAASGLVLDREGTILTSHDVVEQGDLKVVLAGGQEVAATVAGTDPEKNLAALRLAVPIPGLVAAELGNSDSVSVGDPVAAIGAPFGLDQTFTSGVVSAVKRNYAGDGKTPPLKDLIQSDAPINRGAFGGPLVNEAGQVVGINMAIQSPVGAFVGVGFAVPINQAKGDLLERIQEV